MIHASVPVLENLKCPKVKEPFCGSLTLGRRFCDFGSLTPGHPLKGQFTIQFQVETLEMLLSLRSEIVCCTNFFSRQLHVIEIISEISWRFRSILV